MSIACILFDGVASRQEPDEYVEIVNRGDVQQELQGWRLVDISDGAPAFVFPSRVLRPGEVVRVYTNETHTESGGFTMA